MWSSILLFGSLLLCVGMHLFMMRGMHGKQHEHRGSLKNRKPASRAEELQALKVQMDALQADYDRLAAQQIQDHAQAERTNYPSLHVVNSPSSEHQMAHHH